MLFMRKRMLFMRKRMVFMRKRMLFMRRCPDPGQRRFGSGQGIDALPAALLAKSFLCLFLDQSLRLARSLECIPAAPTEKPEAAWTFQDQRRAAARQSGAC